MTPSSCPSSPWLIAVGLLLSACDSHTPSVRTDSGTPRPAAPAVVATTAPPETTPAPQSQLETLSGGPIRATWIRDLGDGTDILGFGNDVVVMGFDSSDGRGERILVTRPGTYAKPLITPRGNRIIYMDRANNGIHIIDWNGGPSTRLLSGFPLAVWSDPETGLEWVYAGTEPQGTDPESYGAIHRHQIDRPDHAELVWNKRAVSGDSFQLSRDGRLAGALARWPAAGVLELPNGSWRQLGEGCWTALASDDSHLFWYFDGQHRNLTIVDTDAAEDDRWTVPINSAPGIEGFEVYHPRWTNHPRFLTMSGPYTVGGADNKIRGGGHGVEIHLGRFSADHREVEAWIQVTTNNEADFYPDVWIAPDAQVPESARATVTPTAPESPTGEAPIVIEARVLADVPIPTADDIAPYRNGLLVLEYEVLNVIQGQYSESTLLAAHWIIRNAALLDAASRPAGTVVPMTLVPYTSRPELEGQRVVMDSDRYDLPLFYDVTSAGSQLDP